VTPQATKELLGGAALPGDNRDIVRMPGHWLLARLGKRVLRPGGLGMTQKLLNGLDIAPADEIVEFAPGLGVTAGMMLARQPLRYIGVERDAKAAALTKRQLPDRSNISVAVGIADNTALPAHCASVVIGEAMLSMNTHEHKRRIVAEAFRLLRPGGRYGIHELCIVPDDMPATQKRDIDQALSSAIHVGARPLRTSEWIILLEEAGFRVAEIGHMPMHLLRPQRIIKDEGLLGALRLARNIILDGAARRCVLDMRKVFERYRDHLRAIYIVAHKGE
jgi:SAM-dependent methyltransferase